MERSKVQEIVQRIVKDDPDAGERVNELLNISKARRQKANKLLNVMKWVRLRREHWSRNQELPGGYLQ